MLDRSRAQDVQAHGALTHGGTAGDDDELARVEPIGQLVEFFEAGWHAVELTATTAHRFDLVERLLHDVVEPDDSPRSCDAR